MAWEENPRICLHMQLIAILSRTGVNTETWLLDQKNFERSEILGFYLYLRPAIQDFTVFAFTTPRHVNYRIRSCSEQSFAAQTGIGKA